MSIAAGACGSTMRSTRTVPVVRSAGWSGNQVLGGMLLQTVRRVNAHACNQRFNKFITLCTEQQVVYNEETGQALSVNAPTGGLRPYGVDPIFLPRSAVYNSLLNICERLPHLLV